MGNISPDTDDFYSYYTSAPTSPRKNNHQNSVIFLSMPTSPTRDPPGFDSGSITPVTHENFTPYVDNFEFEGSKRFASYAKEVKIGQGLPMAYADELFHHGKMLPLRLPPGACSTRPDKRCGSRSTASSPRARGSNLKFPFLKQRSLLNDGFDPFLAALNKVKDEKVDLVGQHGKKAQLRRSKSLSSSFRSNRSEDAYKHKKMDLSPNENAFGPLKRNFCGPIQEPKEHVTRKQRIKKFLFNNASFGKEVEVPKVEHTSPLLLRKMQNSQKFGVTNSNTLVRISKEMKSLMKHRAKIFFCMAKGFGIKGTTK